MDQGDHEEFNGKTIAFIKNNGNRETYHGDDPGITIHFTDGSTLEIGSGCGQNCGYLTGI